MKSKRILQILTLIFCLLLVSTQWIQVEAKDYQIDRKTVKEMLSYEYDEAVFTAYAFMNYTGFNDNNGMPFSQVREGVRKDLQKKNPKLKDNHYFNNKGFESYFYPGFLLVTNGAPHFQPVHYHKIPENVRRNYGFLSTAIEAGMCISVPEH